MQGQAVCLKHYSQSMFHKYHYFHWWEPISKPFMQINKSLICYWTSPSDTHFVIAWPVAEVWVMKPWGIVVSGVWVLIRTWTACSSMSAPERPCGQGLVVSVKKETAKHRAAALCSTQRQLSFLRWPQLGGELILQEVKVQNESSWEWVWVKLWWCQLKVVPWNSEFICITRTVFYTISLPFLYP